MHPMFMGHPVQWTSLTACPTLQTTSLGFPLQKTKSGPFKIALLARWHVSGLSNYILINI